MNGHISSESLSAYLDGESRAAELRKLEAHLEVCTTCTDRLERLRGTAFAVARSVRREAPPPYLAARIRSRVAAEEAARGPVARFFRFLLDVPLRPGFSAPLAAGLTVVLSTLLLSQGMGPSSFAPSVSAGHKPKFKVTEGVGDVSWVPQTTTEVAGRQFVLRYDVWVQSGVSDIVPSDIVATGSPQGKEILARLSGLAMLLADGSRVVIRDQRRTLELSSGS